MKQPGLPKTLRSWRGTSRAWAAVYFAGSGAGVAVARAGDAEPHISQQTTVAAPSGVGEPAAGSACWPAVARAVRQQFDPREHRIVTAVGGVDALCRTLSLPATEPAELRQMLDLQIDNLTPLPLEEVVYDFEPLETGAGQTRVLVAIARKTAINERVAALEAAGLPPEAVGIDALALFHGLIDRALLPRDEKLNALVLVRDTGADVLVHSRGQLIGLRSIALAAGGLEGAAGRTELEEELQRTLVAEQADNPQCAVGQMSFGAWDEAGRGAAAVLAKEWPGAALLANGAVPAPAAGLCLAAARRGGPRLNLLPAEWRQRRRAAHTRRLLIRSGIALAVLYFVILAGCLAATAVRNSRLRQVRAEVQRLEPQVMAARRLQSQLVAMQNQLDTKYSALEVLRQVSLLMPENLKLSAFVFRKEEAVTLRGQADSAPAVYDFISKLEHCELFASVKTVAVRTENAAGLTKFELLASLKSAAGKPGPVP